MRIDAQGEKTRARHPTGFPYHLSVCRPLDRIQRGGQL